VEVAGRAAHAGIAPEEGASAIVELAHQILKIQSFNDPESGTTVNVGTVRGGTTPNVVPASASAAVDARAATVAGAQTLEAAMAGLAAVTPGTRVSIAGGFNRPPMERTAAIAALFERARAIGATLGLKLIEAATGGGSDGNFIAAVGTPVLDGLGTLGGGAHADDEHVLFQTVPERAALLAALWMGL